MLNQFIYSHPTWMWGSLLVAFAVAASCAGLAVFERFVGVDIRRAHNDLAGFIVAVISVTYAVLLAFIAIAVWESYTAAQENVENEATLIGNIYRDTQGLPADMASGIRADAREYIDIVVTREWPAQQHGLVPEDGWPPLHRLHAAIASMRPEHLGESVVEAELLKTLNQLYLARESRMSAVEGHLPDVLWAIIVLGAVITIGFTYLFGFHDFRMHLAMTASVAASLMLVIILIIAMDWPMRGEVSISSSTFTKIEKGFSDLVPAR